MTKDKNIIWVRLGDTADYESFISMDNAGVYIADSLYDSSFNLDDITWRDRGIQIPPHFDNLNYISLYLGDDEAQPIGEGILSQEDKEIILNGLKLMLLERN